MPNSHESQARSNNMIPGFSPLLSMVSNNSNANTFNQGKQALRRDSLLETQNAFGRVDSI
jgi:hypothetical protein